MITLRQFLKESAPVHGMDIEAARSLSRHALSRHPDAAARASAGSQSSPAMTPVLATRMVLAWLGGGMAINAGQRVAALWATPAGAGAISDIEGAGIMPPGYDAQAAFEAIPKCPITGVSRFGDALLEILAKPDLARTIARVEIVRGFSDALITNNRGVTSRFCSRETMEAQRHRAEAVAHVAYLAGPGLQFIASLLRS